MRLPLRLGALLVGASITVVGVALLTPTNTVRCMAWQQRPIDETYTTPGALRTLRNGTPVHEAPGFLSASLFPPGFGGLALPDRIVVSSRLEAGSPFDREHLIWHEIVHVEQMRQEGALRFAFVYATDWLRGRWSGCGSFSSYEAIRYEREAELYAVAMSVAEWARTMAPRPRGAHPKARGDESARTSSITRVMDIAVDENVELARIVDELVDAGLE